MSSSLIKEPLRDTGKYCFSLGAMILAERIRFARDLKGYTQREVAERMNLENPQAVSNWERGGGISRQNATTLADVLECTLDWLLEEKGTPPGGSPQKATQKPIPGPTDDRVSLGDAYRLPPENKSVTIGESGRIPLYAGASGVPGGEKIDLANRREWRARPLMLMGVDAGFAVRMVGDRMKGKYARGSVVFGNPGLECEPGEGVIVEFTDGTGLVRNFISATEDFVELEFLDPKKTRHKIPRAEVKALHPIVEWHRH